jgi:aarF domain-containing kinase
MEVSAETDRMWDDCHKINAREIREHAENEKGLLIKACQFMSALAGVLPDPYVQEFQVLTEDLPVSSIEEVFRVIQRDLSVKPREIFTVFSPEPIASASIAQVHRQSCERMGKSLL